MLDKNLKKYATEQQWKYLCALEQYGSERKAAAALGCAKSRFHAAKKKVARRAAQQGYAPPDITHEVPDGLTLRGTSIRYDGDGAIQQYWNKTRQAGADPEDCVSLPDPKKITRVSTLYDNQRNVTQQWVSEQPDEKAKEKLWQDFAKELIEDLPRLPKINAPKHGDSDLMAVYPVGDHHNGMLSWADETGENYDLKISEHLLYSAADYLIGSAPEAEQALLIFLGDFNHTDGFVPVTPAHKNPLDADSRFPKIVRTGVRMLRYMTDACLRKHKKVRVIIESGNHDPVSTVYFMECLAAVYEKEPRVSVDTSPSHYHYFEFGNTLVGTHHGHGSKPNDLPLVMAADMPEAWGRSQYRYWYTGHTHVRAAYDYAGCTVESFRILAPTDAWAHQKGYRNIRDMKNIIIHKEFGEVDRHTVNPRMFGKDVRDA